MGQVLTRHTRNVAISIGAAALVAAALVLLPGCSREPHPAPAPATSGVPRGGELVVSVRTEPRTYNRFAARDQTTLLIATLTQARLARINLATEEVEPRLAESWTRSDDGLKYTLRLRSNVRFSDGRPFTSDDVLFSFEAAYDAKAGGTLADAMEVGGRKLRVTAPDPLTVVIEFPSPYAPGLRILDNLFIVPRHKLGTTLAAGTFGDAWGISTPPADIVGLGPFVPVQYVPGQRLTFARNPHYWLTDANGARLPYVDRLTLEVVPEQDAELLRLEAGQIDMTLTEIRPEDYAPLKRAADEGRMKLLDLGVGLDPDSFWINLRPGGLGHDPRALWLQSEDFRRAISTAVDREAFADTVFLGAGVPVYGPETPANKKWYSPSIPTPPYDPERARVLLASLGLADRNGDAVLEDARNQPARFTLITQKGNTALERGAAVIRDDLRKIGVVMDIATLDPPAAFQRFLSGNYEAAFLQIRKTDTDPANNLDFWLSSGSAHLWDLAEKTPVTSWEREIDRLMARQIASPDEGERRKLYDEVQRIFAEHLPVLYFVAPRVYVATSSRVTNLTPAIPRPQLMWTPETIAVVR